MLPNALLLCLFKMTLKSVAVEEISGLYAAVYPGSFSVSLTILRRPLPRRSMYFMRWNGSASTGLRHIERILFSVKNKSENKNGKSVDIFLFAAYNKIIRK